MSVNRTKARKQELAQVKSSRNKWISLLAGAFVLVGVVIVLISSSTNCCAEDSAAIQVITPNQYMTGLNTTDHFLVDVRTPEEFFGGHINGAVNISLQTISNRLSEIPKDQPIVLYCRSGNRSAEAARILEAAGYTEIYDLGGVIAWTAAGYRLQ